jgi:hypothetical protein
MSGSVAFAVCAYLVALASVLAAARATREMGWAFLVGLLLILTIVRALRLDFLLLTYLEETARVSGWYGERARFQRLAMVLAALAITAGGLFVIRVARTASERLALVAGLLLALFIIIRAISLHVADAALGTGVGPLTLSRLIEFGLLGAIAFGAAISWGYSAGAPSKARRRSP